MRLLTVGLSHKTAPVEIREKLAQPADAVPRLLAGLLEARLGTEAFLLSTCNRVEVYAVPSDGLDNGALAGWLAETGGLSVRAVEPHLYRFEEADALRHLFRVAASLDSMVVGEPQILGQVKEAWSLAVHCHSGGPVLHRVVDGALHAAKRVRTETELAREAVSVGGAGVELARQVLGELTGRSALLLGAGAHGKVVARALLDCGLGELCVASRTFSRSVTLAEKFGGSAVHMEDLARWLERTDIVIASTSAGRILVGRADLEPIVRRRRYRSLVLIDLAVPRNIDPAANELDGVFRFDVDDLVQLAEKGMEHRREAAVAAEAIVAEEVERCWSVLVGSQLHARIGAVMRRAERVRQEELERARALTAGLGPEDREALDRMTRALVKKLLHPALARARTLGGEGRGGELDALLDALGEGESGEGPAGEGEP